MITIIYNIHIEKYQTKDIVGIHREAFREYKESEYKNNVDKSLSHLNNVIEVRDGGVDWYSCICEAKESTREVTGRAVRKDAVVLCSAVESVPPNWPKDACENYFKDKVIFLDDYLHESAGADKNCMLTAVVHFDETTPHATYAFVPLKDGKLQAKNILTKEFYSKFQADTYEFAKNWIAQYEKANNTKLEPLEAYTIGSQRTHLNEAQYKEKKALENVALANEQAQKMKEEIQTETNKLEANKVNFKASVAELEMAKENVLQNQKEALEAKKLYDSKLVELTSAPNVETYEQVVNQNQQYRRELSLKDQIIEGLKAEVEHFKRIAAIWQEKFDSVCNHFGTRILNFLGVENENVQRELPTKAVIDNINAVKQEIETIDIRKTRIIPDQDGKFKIVIKNDDKYDDIKVGFKNREDAEKYQKELKEASVKFLIDKEYIKGKRI